MPEYDLKDVANADELFVNDPMDLKYKGETLGEPTRAILNACASGGIGRITEENWTSFFLRVKALDAIQGRHDTTFSMDMVHRHIGLRTDLVGCSDQTFWNQLQRRGKAAAEGEGLLADGSSTDARRSEFAAALQKLDEHLFFAELDSEEGYWQQVVEDAETILRLARKRLGEARRQDRVD